VAETPRASPRSGRYLGAAGLILLVLVGASFLLDGGAGSSGVQAGQPAPPFALPLVTGNVPGDANVAKHANEGSAGARPACSVRGAGLLNLCQLYEGAPLVLALFIEAGSCPGILDQLQALAPSFPGVRFAGVVIAGDRSQMRKLVNSHHLTLPVGIDSDGAVGQLYRVLSCPQLTFIYPGGIVQGKPLLSAPSRSALRARIAQLVAGSRAREWQGVAVPRGSR
jgi:hypothetical protein